MNVVHQQAAAEQQGLGSGSALTLVERVAKAVTDFNNQLSSAQTGALSQVRKSESMFFLHPSEHGQSASASLFLLVVFAGVVARSWRRR